MSPTGSVTFWLARLQEGDPAAAEQLWERYFCRLVGFARKKLQAGPRRAADEEDVALSAFNSFWNNAQRGKLSSLLDRDSLWRLLMVITARKAIHLIRDEGRQKRGAGAAVDPEAALENILSQEPTPEFAAELADECERLMSSLGDPELERIALWKMEGHTVEEIAVKLDCAPRTVKRKLQLIRTIWETEK